MLKESNSNLLPLIKNEENLPKIDPSLDFSGLFLVGTVFTAINLATVIKYDVTVKANATVHPTGNIRLVQAAESGSIKSILVKPGRIVERGDIIAIIDDSQLQTRKIQLEDNIEYIKKQHNNLYLAIEQLDTQIFYQNLSIDRAVEIAKDDYNRLVKAYQNRQITTFADVEEAKAELTYAEETLKRDRQLAETGAIASLEIHERDEAFKTARARLSRALAEQNPTKANIAIAQGKIDREREKGKNAIAALKKGQQKVRQTQFELQKQIASDKKQIEQIEIQLKKTVIRSPIAGTILELKLENLGQKVSVGDEIAKIAPKNAPLVVKARLNPQDIGKISVCKTDRSINCMERKVAMKISTYPYPNYGTLKGTVKAVSASTILPQSSIISGVTHPYYEVTIVPDKLNLHKDRVSRNLQAGMEVNADIISRQETVLNFMLKKTKSIANI
jgi:HlyD family type I secretion membrane fusion protein